MVDFTGENIGSYTCGIEKKKSNRFEDRPYFETKLYKCKKGNRVLNENIDKIKFPFGCTYYDVDKDYNITGKLAKGIVFTNEEGRYILYNIDKQHKYNYVDSCTDLRNLISAYYINILKMKILLFQK
jgi:hypothetical protein